MKALGAMALSAAFVHPLLKWLNNKPEHVFISTGWRYYGGYGIIGKNRTLRLESPIVSYEDEG